MDYAIYPIYPCNHTNDGFTPPDDKLLKKNIRNLEQYEHIVDKDSMELRLTNLTLEDSGNYFCKVNESTIGGDEDKDIAYSVLSVGGELNHTNNLGWPLICYIYIGMRSLGQKHSEIVH